jgi:hypothetical protein
MKKYFSAGILFFFCLPFYCYAQAGKASSSKNQPKSYEEAVAKFCLANTDAFDLIKKWIKDNKGKNTTVAPLAMDPSCHDCHDPSQFQKDTAKINAWMTANNKPESDMMTTLLKMHHDWRKLGGSNNIDLSLPKCFYHFSDDDFFNMEVALEERGYERVMAMARKYKGFPQYAFAGIIYVLNICREKSLLISNTSPSDEGVQIAGEWMQTCYNQFDKRLFKDYQYQLYPTYIYMIRQLYLTGVQTEFDDLGKWIKKMNDFMQFKLKVEFEASGHGDDGGKFHALVSGETIIQCKLKEDCYVWEPMDGNEMQFKIKDVVFQSDQGKAVYKSPATFSVPVTIKVGMCTDNPTFKISFGSFGDPNETYATADGQDIHSPLLYSLAVATLGSANLNRMQNQAENIRKNADKTKGKEAEVEAAAKRLNQHKNDPSYLNSAQGKADMSLMKQMAKSGGYDPDKAPDPKRMQNLAHLKAMNVKQQEINNKYTLPGYVGSAEYDSDKQALANLKSNVDMNDLTGAIGFDANVLQIEAPFTIGVPKPVDKIQRDKVAQIAGSANGWEYGEFHVTVEHKEK